MAADEQTAWHEAGHAVVYCVLGLPFRYVTIRPRTPGLVGQVAVRPARRPGQLLALAAAAGPVAEVRYSVEREGLDEEESTWAVGLLGCSDSDRQLVQDVGLDVAVTERAAGQILDPLWPAVGEVAERLLETPATLRPAEVQALVAAALPAYYGARP